MYGVLSELSQYQNKLIKFEWHLGVVFVLDILKYNFKDPLQLNYFVLFLQLNVLSVIV